MRGNLVQRIHTWARGWTGRFLLTQLAHTAITVAVLAALLLGAARVGALDGVLSSAAAPASSSFTTVNYQGRLADASGNPIDNTNPGVGMSFILYAQETGGSPVWTETHANVPVSEGLFSVRLGSINALSTDLLTGDRWLGIQVGTDPEMTPREKLAAVPYAMQALTVPDGTITLSKLASDALPSASWTGEIHYSSSVVMNDTEQPFPGTDTTIQVSSRSMILVVATANLDVNGAGHLYADICRDGVSLAQTHRHSPSVVDWTNWAWSFVDIVDAGTHTYQLCAKGTPGLQARWYRPSISLVAIPHQQ